MHASARENGRLFFETYVRRLGPVSILDIGSRDVNGTLREFCPPGVAYTGVDIEPGKGVDLVLADPYALPFADASFDAVLSTSCFEHTELFWLTFLEALRVLRPEGLFYLNAPSNGAVHRYPADCWRFYPDAGRALVGWARRSGLAPALLESFTARRTEDCFNDFVAVFVKDAACAPRHPKRILSRINGFTNGVLFGREDMLNTRMATQDQDMLGWKEPAPSLGDRLGSCASRVRRHWLPRLLEALGLSSRPGNRK